MQRTLLAGKDKFASAKPRPIVDSEELQLIDECNRKWVKSWKKALKK